MNENNFLSFLQQLLTMTDPSDAVSVERAQTALHNVVELAISSHMVTPQTHQMMVRADHMFQWLLRNRRYFAGVPGDYERNAQKRRRLGDVLYPAC